MRLPDAPRLDRPTEVLAHLDAHRTHSAYAPGSLVVLLADHDARPVLGLTIDEMPPDPPPQHERVQLLVPLLRRIKDDDDDVAGFVLVVCRLGAPEVDGDDYAWHDVAVAATTSGGPRCLGVYVQTRLGALPVLPHAA